MSVSVPRTNDKEDDQPDPDTGEPEQHEGKKTPRWNWVNTLVSWALATVTFFYLESRQTTIVQTILVIAACLVIVSLVNLGIDVVRTRGVHRAGRMR